MVNAILIEQNEQAAVHLSDAMTRVEGEVFIAARFHTIEAALQYLSTNPVVDIIFSEVKIQNEFSFKIFDQTNICTPVIFVTTEDEYMLKAFEYNCIAYLLKPVDTDRLKKALDKYRLLYKREGIDRLPVNHHVGDNHGRHIRHRMLVKKGKENISLAMSDIVLFHTENRTVYVIDRKGREFVADKNLCDIELELDREIFFRVNRQYIVNINFIYGYKPFEKVKLVIELSLPKLKHHFLVVSQEMAPLFREWIYNA